MVVSATGRCHCNRTCFCVEHLKATVGSSSRRYVSHASATSRGTRSAQYQQAARVASLPVPGHKPWSYHHKDRLPACALKPHPSLFPLPMDTRQ